MPISIKKYVDIKSGISNIRTATEKELIARIFTNSADMTEDVVECENLAEVSAIFGTSSDEYAIAEKYFNFVNKYARNPRKISYGKIFEVGTPTIVYGMSSTANTLEYIKTNQGTRAFGIQIGGYSSSFQLPEEAVNNATSLEDLAERITAVIQSLSTEVINKSSVSFENQNFIFNTGVIGAYEVTLTGVIAELLKLDSDSPTRTVDGETHYDYTEVFKKSYQTNNNFGSFVFLGVTDATELATLANYVKSNYPSEFLDVIPVTSENYSTIQSAVANIDGVSLELCGTTDDTGKFNFVLPMAITASTDYNKENGTVNYMYTQDPNMSVVVDTDSDAEQYDEVKVNYYGRTQQAGQKLAFYQNGVLQGNFQDQNVFVNEIWLKDALSTKFLNYMLLTSNWYANQSGQAVGQGLIADVVERAKLNGTITTEKELTEADKAFIYNITADENAWRQIYQEGYYLITSISKEKVNNQDTYKFNYTLLYSKGDSIKKVEGYNILI